MAISDHYLLTASHAVQWVSEERGVVDPDHTTLTYPPLSLPKGNVFADFRIRGAQDFFDEIDRNDMIDNPSEDDYTLECFAFADSHDPERLYFVEEMEDTEPSLDLMLLYSPRPLPHATYPKPAKSRTNPYQSYHVGLVAYHGDETRSIYRDYPSTSRADLTWALNKLMPDRLTIIQGTTSPDSRDDRNMIYHRCSSAAGSSGGALVNGDGEIVGIALGSDYSNVRYTY